MRRKSTSSLLVISLHDEVDVHRKNKGKAVGQVTPETRGGIAAERAVGTRPMTATSTGFRPIFPRSVLHV
jgi:hypothetical protein